MKKLFKPLIYVVLFCVMALAFCTIGAPTPPTESTLSLSLEYTQNDIFQIFYDTSGNFSEEQSVKMEVVGGQPTQLTIPLTEGMDTLRLDWGTVPGNMVTIQEIIIETPEGFSRLDGNTFLSLLSAQGTLLGQQFEQQGNDSIVFTEGDPFAQMTQANLLHNMESYPLPMMTAVIATALSLLLTFVVYKVVYLKDIAQFARNIITSRKLLFSLAINDFKVKYAGSYFGIIWAFVQPICTILVFWFVFEMGFRSGSVSDVPFALWLSAGMIPWFFFSDGWNSATNTFIEYSYLVKKVVFKIDILPMVKILSAFFVHLFFIAFLVVLFLANGIMPTWHLVELLYYTFCMITFMIGLSFITSSIVVFFKDLGQIIAIILQFGMWLAPIMWQPETFGEQITDILKYNPMYYIIDGYRNSVMGTGVYPPIQQTVLFWTVAIFTFFVGISLFRRLKVHFADVL